MNRAWPGSAAASLLLTVIVLLCAGCSGKSDTIALPRWNVVSPSGARHAVTLPAWFKTDFRDPKARVELETTAHLPARWRGHPVTLSIPLFYGPATLMVDGRRVPSEQFGNAHAFRVDDAAHAGEAVPLHLELDARYSPLLPAPPRLSPTEHGDAAFLFAGDFNFVSTVAVMSLAWLLAVFCLVVFAYDPRRHEYGWSAVFLIAGPFMLVGEADTFPLILQWQYLIANVTGVIILVAAIGFFRAYFLRAPWSWKWLPGIAIPMGLAFWLRTPTTIPLLYVVSFGVTFAGLAYIVQVTVRQLRKPEKRFAALLLSGAFAIAAVIFLPEIRANLGYGELLDGLRTVPLGTGLMYVGFAAVLGRDFVRSLRETEARVEEIGQLNDDLRYQVAERSRELTEVLARVETALPPATLAVGDVFDRRYKVVRALGQGGMGAVYEVERTRDGRRLALKVVTQAISGRAAARFAREAEIGARVQHPNLVAILDVGVASGGTPFLVMELVEGGSMEDQRARFGNEPWALPLLRQIATGLAELHTAGIVHRDLKPANVLLADDNGQNVAKISDFGISRFGALDDSADLDVDGDTVQAAPKASELTQTGAIMGTPVYMPPEAAIGAAQSPSADVFSFGVLAYEALTGRAPFAMPPVLLARTRQPVPEPEPLDGIDTKLAELVLACVCVEPAERPKAKDLAGKL